MLNQVQRMNIQDIDSNIEENCESDEEEDHLQEICQAYETIIKYFVPTYESDKSFLSEIIRRHEDTSKILRPAPLLRQSSIMDHMFKD